MARILIVDDSNTEIHVFTRMLEKHGHEVLVAKDGQKGLDLAVSQTPDLILMDIVMPGMDGFQATRRISTNPTTKHIPIIMISTKDQETDQIWAMRQGATAYIIKPIDEYTLTNMVKDILIAKR